MFTIGAPPSLHVCTEEDVLSTQIVGWLLTVGTFASFLPQISDLLSTKNLEGLSALTWALNFLSNMLTMLNAVMLNWTEIQCCEILSAGQCLEGLVPLVQLAVPAICTFVIFLLTTLYSDNMTEIERYTQDQLKVNSRRSTADFFAFLFGNNSFVRPLFVASLLFTFAVIGAGTFMMAFLGSTNSNTVIYAKAAGIGAVAFLMVMYIPQIYTTFSVKRQGSLSLVTLLVQCPGSLAVVYFDAVQSHLSWTTWAPYLVSAAQQFVLIVMCLYYRLRYKEDKAEVEPLLPSTSTTSLSPYSSSPYSSPLAPSSFPTTKKSINM